MEKNNNNNKINKKLFQIPGDSNPSLPRFEAKDLPLSH